MAPFPPPNLPRPPKQIGGSASLLGGKSAGKKTKNSMLFCPLLVFQRGVLRKE